jgi:pimeloyl-ACP methyl ester carboxylesterase
MVIASPAIERDGSRARQPDESGFIERDGVRVAWDRYEPTRPVVGDPPTVVLLPSWSIVHARVWKAQIPDFSRPFRVIAFDGRGNGRSDRPPGLDAYAVEEFAADALAVMDATRTGRAVLVSLSMGAQWGLLLAARHPERVAGAVFIGPALPLAPPDPASAPSGSGASFDDEQETYEGWDKYNRHFWRRDYRGFLEFFFAESLSEPHSTKPIEDCVGWGLDTDAETLLLTEDAPTLGDREAVLALARSVRCPVLVLHGSDDHIVRHAHGATLAAATGGELVTFEGSGHILPAREPVRTNLLIRAFVDRVSGGSR